MFISSQKYKEKIELLAAYMRKNKVNVERINDYKGQVYELKKLLDKSQKMEDVLYSENQKLTNWIYNILKEFGICKVSDRNPIKIPIYRIRDSIYNEHTIYDKHNTTYDQEEYIEIPAITIVKVK